MDQVRAIYDKMSILAHKALDPTLLESANSHPSDKDLLNKEFQELSEDLDGILSRKSERTIVIWWEIRRFYRWFA